METYHLGCKIGSVKEYAVLFGNSERCELVKGLIDGSELLSSKSGFMLYNGSFRGMEFTFGNIGIGGPSWAIGLHELAESGSRLFLRVGTSGILSSSVSPGDLVIADEAMSDEATSKYILGFRARLVPDAELTDRLAASCSSLGFDWHKGQVHSKDFLYMEEPELYPSEKQLRARLQQVASHGALITEMECAALFAFGLARNYKTAAILAALGNDEELSKRTQKKAVEAALNALLQCGVDENV